MTTLVDARPEHKIVVYSIQEASTLPKAQTQEALGSSIKDFLRFTQALLMLLSMISLLSLVSRFVSGFTSYQRLGGRLSYKR